MFFSRMQGFVDHYIKPIRQKRRIKVAILDSGIDVENSTIQAARGRRILEREEKGDDVSHDDPIKLIKTFTETDVGTHEHGTHVAGILMRVAPYADIYDAKISGEARVAYVDHIAEVLRMK
jgi:subtilisin family serine protease